MGHHTLAHEQMSVFLERLASRRRYGVRPGLDSIRALLAALGNPERELRAIHIAGTNGKGAVAATIDAALRSCSLRVARYTSPHLLRLAERFCIDGRPMDDAVLESAAARVESVLESSELASLEITFFEALTAIAFLAFKEANVDVAVLETGLGGRLDATNVCNPLLSVITRIGLDHCDILGSTQAEIAREKGGIIKSGAPVVLAKNDDETRGIIESIARERNSPCHYAPDVASEADVPADFPLKGAFNRENAVTAIAALRVLQRLDVFPDLRSYSLADVTWPGRYQRIGRFLIDGAHNPPAALALRAALEEELASGEKVTLVAGFCADKDCDEVLRILAPLCASAFAVATANPRSLAPEDLARRMAAAGIPASPMPSLSAAFDAARACNANTVLVCGSLFLAGEALAALGAYASPPPALEPAELF